MVEKLERQEEIKRILPKISDNLGIETANGILDVEANEKVIFKMLMKGIKPEDEGYGLEIIGNLEIFFGKRPFPEVIEQKLAEAIEKRNLPGLIVGGGSSLARLGFGIQDFLVDSFNWYRYGAYFHDTEAPFFWFNMPELVGDPSGEGFKNTLRHEFGHFFEAIDDHGRDLSREGLMFLGTACGVEILTGAGGFLVCRLAEKAVDRRKLIGEKEKINVSRRQFVRWLATGAAVLASTPIMHESMIRNVYQNSQSEKEAFEKGSILTDEEIKKAFSFKFRR